MEPGISAVQTVFSLWRKSEESATRFRRRQRARAGRGLRLGFADPLKRSGIHLVCKKHFLTGWADKRRVRNTGAVSFLAKLANSVGREV